MAVTKLKERLKELLSPQDFEWASQEIDQLEKKVESWRNLADGSRRMAVVMNERLILQNKELANMERRAEFLEAIHKKTESHLHWVTGIKKRMVLFDDYHRKSRDKW